jgi:hypothetical protein
MTAYVLAGQLPSYAAGCDVTDAQPNIDLEGAV